MNYARKRHRIELGILVVTALVGIAGCGNGAEAESQGAGTSSSSSSSSTSTDPDTSYTTNTFPFVGPDRKTVVGTAAFDKLIAVPYAAPAGTSTLNDVGQAAVRQFFVNRSLVAQGMFDKRYGPIGPETSISSRYYLDAYLTLADPSLTDTTSDGEFVQNFLGLAEGPMHEETVTDTVLTNTVLATTDETSNQPTLEFWTRVTETTTDSSGQASSQILYFNGGLSVENGDWLVTGWKQEDANSASGIAYGPMPTDSSTPTS